MAGQEDERKESCTWSWFNSASAVGDGNLVVDDADFNGGMFLSTNVNVKVGNVSNAMTFDYTFHSGGEKLAGWTVTLNGSSAKTAIVGDYMVSLRRDATGIWVKVRESTGLTIKIK